VPEIGPEITLLDRYPETTNVTNFDENARFLIKQYRKLPKYHHNNLKNMSSPQ